MVINACPINIRSFMGWLFDSTKPACRLVAIFSVYILEFPFLLCFPLTPSPHPLCVRTFRSVYFLLTPLVFPL